MSIINLRNYYPGFYTEDYMIEVPPEVLAVFTEHERREAAYRLRTYRHKAYFSLNCEDGIEHEALFVALSPWEIYERKVTVQELQAALAALPAKQAGRIYAHYILGHSKAEIARREGVHKSQVTRSIQKALFHMENFLKNRL